MMTAEEFVDPDGCGESKENEIRGTILNKLHNEWFKGTDEDDDDLEGIIDYLEPTLYDGFVDLDDEEYKERKWRLLEMPYIKPPPILIEKVNVTRDSIVNGDSVTLVASASAGAEGPIPPKTAEQKLARKNELKAKSTLMLAIPDEHLLKFHACKESKSLWEAIKNRFGGNKESKMMQKTILKQNYENFAASSQEGLDKTYDRFQKIISQLEIYGEVISQEDANIKLLINNSSSTNETVNTVHSVSAASSKDQASTASYIDADDLEEMDLKWQVAMLTIRVKRFIKTMAPRNQRNKNRDAPKRNALVDTSTTNALVVQDRIGSSSSDIEKDDLKLKLENFEESSKNLTKLINSQISAKDKTVLGYDGQINESKLNNIHMNKSEVVHIVFNSRDSDVDDNLVNDRFKTCKGFHAVPPPYTGNYMPSRPDLSFVGLDDSVFKYKVSETITSKDSLEKPKSVKSSAPLIEEWESDNEDENLFKTKEVKKIVKPSFEKIEFVNARNSTVEKPRKFILTKSGQVPVDAAKQSSHRATVSVSAVRRVNTVAYRPNVNDALPTYSYFKAHSPVRRPFNQKSAAKTNNFKEKVNTARFNNVTNVGPKAVVNAAEGNRDNVGNPQYALQDQGIFDSGCYRYMTGNKFYLLDYQEIDGGFVAFGESPKGGKITRKG
ncbi:hypothetical protein Tco_0543275 [Tanacetum coccineum]